MWFATDEKLRENISKLRDADKLLAHGRQLLYGYDNVARDLDLAVECLIRAAEYGNRTAADILYFINENNAAEESCRPRINAILARHNPYRGSVRMLVVHTAKYMHDLLLKGGGDTEYWQYGLSRLKFAAGEDDGFFELDEAGEPRRFTCNIKRDDVFAKWELALHYMVGRGCVQNRELARKYAEEAYKRCPRFKCFIPEYLFSAELPSLDEVREDPNMLNRSLNLRHCAYTFLSKRDIFFYPELLLNGCIREAQRWRERDDFLAIWPEFHHLFKPRKSLRFPFWLLKHRPQFAELLPVDWSAAKGDHVFLLRDHQKFERYLKPEQFDSASYKKIIISRPEYARFAGLRTLTGQQIADIIIKKSDSEIPPPKTPEERLLAMIFGKTDSHYTREMASWVRAVSKYCGDPDLLRKKIGPGEIVQLNRNLYCAYDVCLAVAIPDALEIKRINDCDGKIDSSSELMKNPFVGELTPEARLNLFLNPNVELGPSLLTVWIALELLKLAPDRFRRLDWESGVRFSEGEFETFFEQVITMDVRRMNAVVNALGKRFVDWLGDVHVAPPKHEPLQPPFKTMGMSIGDPPPPRPTRPKPSSRTFLTAELGKKLYAAGVDAQSLLFIYRGRCELLSPRILANAAEEGSVCSHVNWETVLPENPELLKVFFKSHGISAERWSDLSDEEYGQIIRDYPEFQEFHRRTLPAEVMFKIFADNPDAMEFLDFSTLTYDEWERLVVKPESFLEYHLYLLDEILSRPSAKEAFAKIADAALLWQVCRNQNDVFFKHELYRLEKWADSPWHTFPPEMFRDMCNFHRSYSSSHDVRKSIMDSPADVSRDEWCEFFSEHPEYFRLSPRSFTKSQLRRILLKAGGMLKDVFDDMFEKGELIYPQTILMEHPELINEKNRHTLSEVTGGKWAFYLRTRPELAQHCYWDKIDDDHWIKLLSYQPQYANMCRRLSDLELSDYLWERILEIHPELSPLRKKNRS
jgi:hypothetical protein